MLLPCAARFGPAAEEEFREERRQAQRMAAAAAWEAEKADARVNKVTACPCMHLKHCGVSTSVMNRLQVVRGIECGEQRT